MTILSQVYSGHTTDDPLIPCLEIRCPAFAEPIRNCAGFEDQTVTLEDSTEATFIASGLDVALRPVSNLLQKLPAISCTAIASVADTMQLCRLKRSARPLPGMM